jgi:hypothetical protein
MRLAATGGSAEDAESAYRAAARALAGAGMPGVEQGILPLAILCLRVWRRRPLSFPEDTDWGPYVPWVRPLLLLHQDRRDEAAEALGHAPEPPPDLLLEALWCLRARAAIDLGDRGVMARAHAVLLPAAGELAGAGSGMLTAGPVADHLRELADTLASGGVAP